MTSLPLEMSRKMDITPGKVVTNPGEMFPPSVGEWYHAFKKSSKSSLFVVAVFYSVWESEKKRWESEEQQELLSPQHIFTWHGSASDFDMCVEALSSQWL